MLLRILEQPKGLLVEWAGIEAVDTHGSFVKSDASKLALPTFEHILP